MHQIVSKDISPAEVPPIPPPEHLEPISPFQVDENCLNHTAADPRSGVVERDGRRIYRFRSGDYRLYFTVEEGNKVIVQRVLHANSLKDFLFRSSIGGSEDQKLSGSRPFWRLIEEGEQAPRR